LFVLAAAAATLSLYRQSGVGATNTLWAEDGHVFLGQATTQGIWRPFTETWHGYVHMAPRLLAAGLSQLPLSDAAFGFAVAAATVTGLVTALVFHLSSAVMSSPAARLVAALGVALIPSGQHAVLNNIANLHWFLIFASFWVLLCVARTPTLLGLGSVVTFLAAASDPLAVMLLPLAGLRLASVRGRAIRAPEMALCLGLLVEVVAVLTANTPRVRQHATWLQLLEWLPVHGVSAAILGDRFFGTDVNTSLPLGLVVSAVVLAVAVAVARLDRKRRYPLVTVLVIGIVISYLFTTAVAGGTAFRYSALPSMFLAAIIGLGIDALVPLPSRQRMRLFVLGAFAIAVCSMWAHSYRTVDRRGNGPTWTSQLAIAKTRCEQHPNGFARIQITPMVPMWTVRTSCSRVMRG
jgi:hypothetical protein